MAFECFRHDYTVQYLEKKSCFFFFFTEYCISEINAFAEFDFVCVRKASFSNEKVQLLCKNAQRKKIFF